jgi:hypothetical protein
VLDAVGTGCIPKTLLLALALANKKGGGGGRGAAKENVVGLPAPVCTKGALFSSLLLLVLLPDQPNEYDALGAGGAGVGRVVVDTGELANPLKREEVGMLLLAELLPKGAIEGNKAGGGGIGGGTGAVVVDDGKPPNPENKERLLMVVVGTRNGGG